MWEIKISSQLSDVLYSLLLGLFLCLFYDIFRAWRKNRKQGIVAVFFCDILFWIVCFFLIRTLLLARSAGEVRGYILFFTFVGFLICRVSISRIWMFLLNKVIGLAKAVKKEFSAAIIFLNRVIDKLFALFSSFCMKTCKKTSLIIKKLLKPRDTLVYTDNGE